MRRVRVIPVLLLSERKLVKTREFKNERYVGDCENALKIFSEKGVDELVILDIHASEKGPDYLYIENLLNECFMPLAYGGGISKIEQAQKIFSMGVEKIVLGTATTRNPDVITTLAKQYGSQSVVVCIDVKQDWLGRERVFVDNGKRSLGIDPVTFAKQMEALGAGEIILQSISRDGTESGYDTALIKKVSAELTIPLVALGGASDLNDFVTGVKAGASAVAAGSMFVFKGTHRAVLISYPSQNNLREEFYSAI